MAEGGPRLEVSRSRPVTGRTKCLQYRTGVRLGASSLTHRVPTSQTVVIPTFDQETDFSRTRIGSNLCLSLHPHLSPRVSPDTGKSPFWTVSSEGDGVRDSLPKPLDKDRRGGFRGPSKGPGRMFVPVFLCGKPNRGHRFLSCIKSEGPKGLWGSRDGGSPLYL